jgi:hypothetical protein
MYQRGRFLSIKASDPPIESKNNTTTLKMTFQFVRLLSFVYPLNLLLGIPQIQNNSASIVNAATSNKVCFLYVVPVYRFVCDVMYHG